MDVYYRKIYALLQQARGFTEPGLVSQHLNCLTPNRDDLQKWWDCVGKIAADIGSSSDQVNIEQRDEIKDSFQLRHPISAQCKTTISGFAKKEFDINLIVSEIVSESDVKRVFWWLWRFYPEAMASQYEDALLIPSHRVLPDCPLHSYRSTVSALVGAMFPTEENSEKPERPYLLLFTFSPVQEFIKSSRKFLDFWAGSYLLHYLSARLCWLIAQEYGPDAVITPSLWGQEIIDAFIVKEFDNHQKNSDVFSKSFEKYSLDESDPVSRFNEKQSTHLTTAGFPNVITALVPGKAAAKDLGKKLKDQLREEWSKIAQEVRSDIKTRAIAWLTDPHNLESFEFTEADERDLQKWQQHGCWEWNKLWDAQIDNTWESYWTAIPLGNPSVDLQIYKGEGFDPNWIAAIEAIAPSRNQQTTPTEAELSIYKQLNVGTWWANTQSQLGNLIQSVKNTRTWNLPVAPGERSTLSGQFSALHPNLLYNERYREGKGLSSRSMDLFWRLMSAVYPGLFNGSEKLNALELTKRMAWGYGGVPESLGIQMDSENKSIDYENLIRFPNLSSIAAARFACDNSSKIDDYWCNLSQLIQNELPEYYDKFRSRTLGRSFHIYKTDRKINPENNPGKNYNGVMFSSKWLAEDIDLQKSGKNDSQKKNQVLANLVQKAHQKIGFGDGSPGDWWVIVLADGDNMGKYVSGKRLKIYDEYIVQEYIAQEVKEKITSNDSNISNKKHWENFLEKTQKRMGPATHVGMNRALLDFSNRLVPYLTERRFCGKVIYSGGDDVMAVLPLEDLPEYLRSLRAAWCGDKDPCYNSSEPYFESDGGYWIPPKDISELPQRPHFTMGKGATMSMGVVIAYKSVPLPTVLENIWEAEKERAKKLPGKDGICFRVIYGGGNTLEALMKGELLSAWYELLKSPSEELSPLLFRLAEELPKHVVLTPGNELLSQAVKVIMGRRDESKKTNNFVDIESWINKWGEWAFEKSQNQTSLGTNIEDLANLLRFSAFWNDKMVQRQKWKTPNLKEDN